MVQKIQTKILGNNGTPTHNTEKGSRMEMGRVKQEQALEKLKTY